MKLYGKISGSNKIEDSTYTVVKILGKLSGAGCLTAKISVGGGKRYQGDYVVVSSTEEQTLATAQTYMEKDVTVKAIPYSEVSNLTGGTTFFIGKEGE